MPIKRHLDLIFVLLLSYLVRIACVHFHGTYYTDESQCINIVTEPDWGSFFQDLRFDGNPPLFYLLARAWCFIFGSSDLALRIFTVGIGGLVAPVAYILFRDQIGKQRALQLAMLITFSYGAVFYHSLIRPYGLLAILSLVATQMLMKLLDSQNGNKSALSYGASLALLVYTHLSGLLILIGHLFLLAVLMAHKNLRAHQARAFAKGLAFAFLLLLPLAPLVLYAPAHQSLAWSKGLPAFQCLELLALSMFSGEFISPGSFLMVAYVFSLVCFALTLAAPLWLKPDLPSGQAPLFRESHWYLVVVGSILGVLCFDLFLNIFRVRYLTHLFAIFFLIYMLSLNGLSKRLLGSRWQSSLVVFFLPLLLWLPFWIPELAAARWQPMNDSGDLLRCLIPHIDAKKDLVVVAPEEDATEVARFLPETVSLVSFPDVEHLRIVKWPAIMQRLHDPANWQKLTRAMSDTLAGGGYIWYFQGIHAAEVSNDRNLFSEPDFFAAETLSAQKIKSWLESHGQTVNPLIEQHGWIAVSRFRSKH